MKGREREKTEEERADERGSRAGVARSDGAVNVGREERKSGARAPTDERETPEKICLL